MHLHGRIGCISENSRLYCNHIRVIIAKSVCSVEIDIVLSSEQQCSRGLKCSRSKFSKNMSKAFSNFLNKRTRNRQAKTYQCQKCAQDGYSAMRYTAGWLKKHLQIHEILEDETTSDPYHEYAERALKKSRRYRAKHLLQTKEKEKEKKPTKERNDQGGSDVRECDDNGNDSEEIGQVSEQEVDAFQRILDGASRVSRRVTDIDPTLQQLVDQRRELQDDDAQDDVDSKIVQHLLTST